MSSLKGFKRFPLLFAEMFAWAEKTLKFISTEFSRENAAVVKSNEDL